MKTLKTLSIALVFAFAATQANAQSTSVDKIAQAYLGLKNALVASDATVAKAKAAVLLTALSAPADKSLKPAQQKLLSANLEKLKFDSRHISESVAIDHQREHFESLSKNMYTVLSGLKANSTVLYEQYCPMKKAYWLSENKTIQNPYYGKTMPDCGEVKATLAPAGK
ncbi:DUF3347 domain-containing protein [Mucilaginibacter polytrichastri]|uniref:DUF3347 domain-containing protein n=1 Tax=Mucilaginibacter polytrichastri TaxID=1302689 RepID=A0A1Q5ZWS8_9SPHI|nr:DUF3347 domain-containing protein [Mucilaginibacter polytrichastri]OKS86168.1 hypothetical protein RG47T_1619 [Mucilaginibacter polytrichastri]SFT15556.1 Protein of unknown function [Mucilaginibacter polytrichastri]